MTRADSAGRGMPERGWAIDRALADDLHAADPVAALTPRERDVLALIAEGRADRGIREALFVSQKTVEAHIRSIFRKLDLPAASTENRRVHAVLAYFQHASHDALRARPVDRQARPAA